eukprot:2036001-Amphidinium_carterae.1
MTRASWLLLQRLLLLPPILQVAFLVSHVERRQEQLLLALFASGRYPCDPALLSPRLHFMLVTASV